MTEPELPPVIEYDDLMCEPLDFLELSIRALHVLTGSGIQSVGDLVKLGVHEVLRMPGIGPKTVAEIDVALSRKGLWLKGGDGAEWLELPKRKRRRRRERRQVSCPHCGRALKVKIYAV